MFIDTNLVDLSIRHDTGLLVVTIRGKGEREFSIDGTVSRQATRATVRRMSDT